MAGIDTPSYGTEMLRFGGAALLAGGAARALKHVLDVARSRDIRTPLSGKSLRPAISQVPVEVSIDEAEELKRQGVDVTVAPKLAAVNPAEVGYGFTGPFFRKAGLGIAATAGLAAGWKGIDMLAEHQRKSHAQKKRDEARARVEALLDGSPFPQDAKIAGLMLAGEDAAVEAAIKKADFSPEGIVDMGLNNGLVSNLGYVVGPASMIGIVAAYRKARQQAKDEQATKAIGRSFEQNAAVQTPYLTMQPVLAAR